MSSKELAPDEFELYDLMVTVEGGNFVCRTIRTRAFALKAKT